MQKYQDFVIDGSGRPVPGASVSVTTAAGAATTIYSDNGVTPLVGLKTAADGSFAFYAADGRYNIAISKSGIVTKTISDVLLEDPANLSASGGSSLVGHADAVHPIPYLQTVSDILNGLEVSALRYIPTAKHAGIRSGTNADDLTAYFSAALSEGGALYIPDGVWNLWGTASYSGTKHHRIRGAGMGAGGGLSGGTRIVAKTDADLFSFMGGGILTIGDMTLTAAVTMANGVAIHVESNNTDKLSLLAERLYIAGGTASQEFKRGIYTNNANSVKLADMLIRGRSDISSGMSAIEFAASTGSSTIYNLRGIEAYNADKGVCIANSHNLGVEGVKLVDCDLVNMRSGVEFVNTSDYYPPQLSLMGCHINASQYGVYAQKITQLFAIANDIYLSGAASEGMHLADVVPSKVIGNQISVIGSGDASGINVLGTVTGGTIAHNYISLKAGTSYSAITLADNVTAVTVEGNEGVNALKVVNDGTAAAAVNYIRNNFPVDDAYYNPAVTSSAGVLDVRKMTLPTGYATLMDNGATITSIVGSKGQTITLVFNFSSAIQHNAGILLKGGVNLNGVAGNTVTLFKEATSWREIARTV